MTESSPHDYTLFEYRLHSTDSIAFSAAELNLSVKLYLPAIFLPRDATQDVCPSVCHMPVFCQNGWTYPQKLSRTSFSDLEWSWV